MSIQALREHKNDIARQANQLLAEKGDTTWSKDDQAKFDGLMDESERIAGQIAAHQKMLDQRAEQHFIDAARKPADAAKNERAQGVELFLRKSMKDMSAEEVTMVRNTMATTTGSQGGYTVQTDVAREFVDYLKDYGGMRRVADRIATAMGNDMSFPTTDGRAEVGEIVAQNTAASNADAAFGTVPVNTVKFGSKIITVPIELLQDSQIDVVGLVNKRLRDRIGRIQNQKFTGGSGTGEPFGLVTAASVGVTGTTGSTLTVTFDSLVGLTEAVDLAYLAEGGFTFMMSQAARKMVRLIKDNNGRPIFMPGYGSGDVAAPDTILGYEIAINNDMPAPAASAKSISFGQHKKYLIRDAMEVTLFRFDDSAFMSKGAIGFLAWARAGGNLLDNAAVALYQHSAT
ncbi:phage major capsid protein [Brachymonas sp.]|uniref:phage major capsid protein n=1 Tax=Brachymonas sp. TaxID=1936292 RepID=UPI0035B26755